MFIDRRFGEYDEKMSLEEKMLKRFTMEKKVWLIWLFLGILQTVKGGKSSVDVVDWLIEMMFYLLGLIKAYRRNPLVAALPFVNLHCNLINLDT